MLQVPQSTGPHDVAATLLGFFAALPAPFLPHAAAQVCDVCTPSVGPPPPAPPPLPPLSPSIISSYLLTAAFLVMRLTVAHESNAHQAILASCQHPYVHLAVLAHCACPVIDTFLHG